MPSRIVILTGAGSGIGLSLAERLLKRGHTVYGLTRTRKHWPQTKAETRSSKNFHLESVDVSSERAVKRFLSRVIRKEKRIDVLINNAGYANRPCALERETLREWNQNLSSNLISVFLMCKYALPLLKRQGHGWIVNISSMAGKRAVPFLAAYSASKSGVIALSQSIAKENPDVGFRCITVCPGGVNTPMRVKLFGRADARKQQTADFVAEKIVEILDGKIDVPSGGDIVIRHGKITAINQPPEP